MHGFLIGERPRREDCKFGNLYPSLAPPPPAGHWDIVEARLLTWLAAGWLLGSQEEGWGALYLARY